LGHLAAGDETGWQQEAEMATNNTAKAAKSNAKFTPTMRPMRARFAVNGASLIVTARQGVRGYSVQASIRANAKAKPQTGARSVLTDEARARAEFDRLKADAASKGWVETVTANGNAFADIPAPPAPVAATTRKAGAR
jgi:Tfp pilus assembly protein PilV